MVITEGQSLNLEDVRIENTAGDGEEEGAEEEGGDICITPSGSCHIGGIEESNLAGSGCREFAWKLPLHSMCTVFTYIMHLFI